MPPYSQHSLDQDIEFLQRGIDLAPIGQFHRDAIAGKAVLWVKGENFFQSCNFVGCAHNGGFLHQGDLRNWRRLPKLELELRRKVSFVVPLYRNELTLNPQP